MHQFFNQHFGLGALFAIGLPLLRNDACLESVKQILGPVQGLLHPAVVLINCRVGQRILLADSLGKWLGWELGGLIRPVKPIGTLRPGGRAYATFGRFQR